MCAKRADSAKEVAPKQAEGGDEEQQQIQIHVAPDLEYTYRDFFSLYVGVEEVVVELGNRHRAQSNRATVQNRIVLSIPNAFRLQQALGRSLQEAQRRVQEARAQADEEAKDGEGS